MKPTKGEIEKLAKQLRNAFILFRCPPTVGAWDKLPTLIKDDYRWGARWILQHFDRKPVAMTPKLRRLRNKALADYKSGKCEKVENPWSVDGKHHKSKSK